MEHLIEHGERRQHSAFDKQGSDVRCLTSRGAVFALGVRRSAFAVRMEVSVRRSTTFGMGEHRNCRWLRRRSATFSGVQNG
uniref:Uncharacterized protein n=1 Tax=Cucumis melo TaxID=3656 RepID=A0A9I9D9P1_CUCME